LGLFLMVSVSEARLLGEASFAGSSSEAGVNDPRLIEHPDSRTAINAAETDARGP
jgi:hypothetical protein